MRSEASSWLVVVVLVAACFVPVSHAIADEDPPVCGTFPELPEGSTSFCYENQTPVNKTCVHGSAPTGTPDTSVDVFWTKEVG